MAGAVYDPYRDELFGAAYGKGAWVETAGKRTPLAVSASTLGDAIVYAGAPPGMRALKPSLRGIAAVAPHVRTMRLLGSAAIMLAYVAAGARRGLLRVRPRGLGHGGRRFIGGGGRRDGHGRRRRRHAVHAANPANRRRGRVPRRPAARSWMLEARGSTTTVRFCLQAERRECWFPMRQGARYFPRRLNLGSSGTAPLAWLTPRVVPPAPGVRVVDEGGRGAGGARRRCKSFAVVREAMQQKSHGKDKVNCVMGEPRSSRVLDRAHGAKLRFRSR